MEPSSRPLAHPGSLEEAVRQVILDNTRMGYTCQRLVGETENGQASNLRVACSRVISSPVGLQETEEALGGLPQLLTIEDFVSHWGAEWGFDETDVQLAQEGAEYYDAVAGFTRFFAAEGAASTPAAGPSHSPSETGARIKLAPSILSADIARLGEQVAEAVEAGADYIHVDVMDGHYVPNLTFGPLVVEALRPLTQLPLDVHLMVEEPDRIIPEFARAGASIITVHPEACRHLHRTIQNVKEAGCRVGVALNPGTSLNAVVEVLADLDLALVMTVNPGFGGPEVHRVGAGQGGTAPGHPGRQRLHGGAGGGRGRQRRDGAQDRRRGGQSPRGGLGRLQPPRERDGGAGPHPPERWLVVTPRPGGRPSHCPGS